MMAATACTVVDSPVLDRIGALAPPEPVTVTPGSIPACSWQWATQDQPDIAAQLEAALREAGLDDVTVSASAFGENCVDTQMALVQFAAMETDFDLALPGVDPSNRDATGDQVAAVLAIIVVQFPVDSTPGPQPGRITLALGAAPALHITVMQGQAEAALAEGLTGADLLDSLDVP